MDRFGNVCPIWINQLHIKAMSKGKMVDRIRLAGTIIWKGYFLSPYSYIHVVMYN